MLGVLTNSFHTNFPAGSQVGLSDQALAEISRRVVAGQQNPYQLVPRLLEQFIQR